MPDIDELGHWVEGLVCRDLDADALAVSMTWLVELVDRAGADVDYAALREDVMRRTVVSRAWLVRN